MVMNVYGSILSSKRCSLAERTTKQNSTIKETKHYKVKVLWEHIFIQVAAPYCCSSPPLNFLYFKLSTDLMPMGFFSYKTLLWKTH